MRVNAWKPTEQNPIQSWVVEVNYSMYEMSLNADQPNGVCIYMGERSEIDIVNAAHLYERADMIPLGIVRAIAIAAKLEGEL